MPPVRPGVRCPTGEARLTRGYNLPAKFVIHTVGPIWHGGTRGEPDLLASCYSSSLRLAVENNIRTVAFPAISCGVYGFPIEIAAGIAVSTVIEECATHDDLDEVVFVCFSKTDAAVYREEFAERGLAV